MATVEHLIPPGLEQYKALPVHDLDAAEAARSVEAPKGNGTVSIVSKEDVNRVVPAWAQPQEVRDLMDSKDFAGKPVPMGVCTGPAIPWARLVVLFLWGSQLCVMIYGNRVTPCARGAAITPPAWLPLLYIPALLFASIIDVYSVRYTTISFVQVVGKFSLFKQQVPFLVYLAYTMFMGCVERCDMITDSLFIITLQREYACHDPLDSEWSRGYFGTNLLLVACASYILMVPQVIYTLLETTPRWSEPKVDYVVGIKDQQGKNYNIQFTNMLGLKVNLGDTLAVLAEASGNQAIMSQSPEFPMIKEEQARHTKAYQNALNLVRGALSRGMIRIGLVGLMENAFQINVQVIMLTMAQRTLKETGSHEDESSNLSYQRAVLSIVLSLCMCLGKLADGYQLLNFWKTSGLQMERALREAKGLPAGNEDDFTCMTEFADTYQAIIFYKRAIYLMCFLLVLTLAYAAMKVVGLYTCESYVLNMSGCAHLEYSPHHHLS